MSVHLSEEYRALDVMNRIPALHEGVMVTLVFGRL